MFGGYLAFYIKENKALNINMKTDYWVHPKNKLYNPTISHLETVLTISVAHLVFHLPSLISATQSLCFQAKSPIEIVHNLNFCQHICWVLTSTNLLKFQLLITEKISYKMILHLNMFSPEVKGWILGKKDTTLTITVECSHITFLAQLFHKSLQPNHLLCRDRKSVV